MIPDFSNKVDTSYEKEYMEYDHNPVTPDECHGEGIIGGTLPGDFSKPKGMKIDDPAKNAR